MLQKFKSPCPAWAAQAEKARIKNLNLIFRCQKLGGKILNYPVTTLQKTQNNYKGKLSTRTFFLQQKMNPISIMTPLKPPFVRPLSKQHQAAGYK